MRLLLQTVKDNSLVEMLDSFLGPNNHSFASLFLFFLFSFLFGLLLIGSILWV